MPVYGNLPKKKKENASTIGTIETLDKQKKKIKFMQKFSFCLFQTSLPVRPANYFQSDPGHVPPLHIPQEVMSHFSTNV